ncbi:MucR family transcriptional regulator [Methylobacterium radiodurans]|uniref:MucR family transcriptional regulator n=1 Tax=Methylobacterium radiodurans TaxID=2202828 RepID=A0A2U8VWB5_9HYPH|nr:MucR family transcriptional regulator [Methylobacterium radiodurans]AWN37406.1 MucR family transcriptional regulator [Methylobacterium radiodurans]
MAEEALEQGPDIITFAGDIVAAYVSNNPVPASELPALIGNVHAALANLVGAPAAAAAPEEPVEQPSQAQIRKSIAEDGIVSFIDGRAYKTLKRHLTKHGLTPQAYRQRYGLPADYPMVAPSYAAQRSALAKEIGLGRPAPQSGRRDAA